MDTDEVFRARYFSFFDDIITHGYEEDEQTRIPSGTPLPAPAPVPLPSGSCGDAPDPPGPPPTETNPGPISCAAPINNTVDSVQNTPATRKPRQERPPVPSDPHYRQHFHNDHVLLAKEVQLHRHTFTCYKGGRESCRFFFPHELNPQSSYDPETKSISLAVQHPLINWHNKDLLVATRHNHDLKAVQSGKSGAAAASYITSYTTKSDETPANQVSMINTVYQRMAEHMDPTADAHGLLTRCVMQFGRERQLHAQQAATYVRELGDTHQSHKTAPMLSGQVIATVLKLFGPLRSELGPIASLPAAVPDADHSIIGDPDGDLNMRSTTPEPVLHDDVELDDLDVDDVSDNPIRLLNTTGVVYQVDDYLMRPDSLSHLSFYDFVRYVTLSDTPPKKPNSSHHTLPDRHPNAKTHVHRYTPNKPVGIPRPICSRFPKASGDPGHGDAYCSAMLAHFVPFSETSPLKGAGTTWEEAFQRITFPPAAMRVMANWAALSECEDARDADQLLQRRRESERARRTDEALARLEDGNGNPDSENADLDVEQFLRGSGVQSRETMEFSTALQHSGWFGSTSQVL